MKILLIVDDFLPHSIKVAAKMMHEMALELNAQGHYATVLTPSPGQKESLVVKDVEGVNTLFFKSSEIKNIDKIKRAVNETFLSPRAWKATKKYFKQHKFDGIVYYSPSIFFGLLVLRLKRLWHCKSYLILRDIFPQWTVDNGLMRQKSPIYSYFKFFERINYKAANTIGVMSPSNLEFFKKQKIDVSKVEVLYNWSKLPKIERSQNTYRKQLSLENKVVFFYGGNIGHAQNMIYLVDLAKQFKNEENIHFLFVGKGDQVELVIAEKEKYNLNNLTYLPSVDQACYFKMLNEFDVGLFSLHPGHKTHNFPGKLLGYMGYSKPILGCVNPGNDLKEIVNKAGAGFVVDSGNSEALYNAALQLFESEELRIMTGRNGRQLLADQFSIESTTTQIVKAL